MIFDNPAVGVFNELRTTPYFRFSLLAISSIFFLVDPFAAIPSFLAITAGVDPVRRARMARKGAITCFIVLTTFALVGKYIFIMFGITLPAFEVAGGLILLLIGLDMLEAKRSPTQEASGDTEEASTKDDAGIVPLGIPMLAGPGAISSVMVLAGQVTTPWQMVAIISCIGFTALVSYFVLAGAGRVKTLLGGDGDSDPGEDYGAVAGGAGDAVLCEWTYGSWGDRSAGGEVVPI
jgi:multiple antibiotic resistance protein